MLVLKKAVVIKPVGCDKQALIDVIHARDTDIHVLVSKSVSDRSISFARDVSDRFGYSPIVLTHRRHDDQDPKFLKYELIDQGRRVILINDRVCLHFIIRLFDIVARHREFTGRVNLFVDGSSSRKEIWKSSPFVDEFIETIQKSKNVLGESLIDCWLIGSSSEIVVVAAELAQSD